MSVPVSHSRVRVTQELLKIVQVSAVHPQMGRERMAHIVQAEIFDARRLASADESDADLCRGDAGEDRALLFRTGTQ